MFENHEKVSFIDFRGLYNRGNARSVPPTHARIATNCAFNRGKVKVRDGYKIDATNWTAFGYLLVEVFPFNNTLNGRTSYLFSTSSGSLYWMSDAGVISGPIGSIPIWAGFFSAIQVGNRIYIMPYSEFTANLYVWIIGNPTIRLAGGTAPGIGPALTMGGSASGNIEPGWHTIAVAFETDTGFITAPSPVSAINNIFGSSGVNCTLSSIPTGPVGTVARHVLMSKRATTYNGDPRSMELFFAHKIADNVTTSYVLSQFDTSLLNSADYLFDQRSTIPNARGLCYYDGRLVVFGLNENRDIIIVSKKGEPEAFNSVDGNIIINPASRYGVLACASHHSILYIWNSERTLATQDNGEDPVNWEVTIVDSTVGISNNGLKVTGPSRAVASIFGSPGGTINDTLIVNTNTGLRLFDGHYGDELTFNISSEADWSKYNEVLVDQVNKRIHVRIMPGLLGFTYTTWYVGDYSEGLSSEQIKWSKWLIDEPNPGFLFESSGSGEITCRLTIDVDGSSILWSTRWRLLSTNNVWHDGGQVVPGDVRTLNISWVYEFPFLGVDGWINQVSGIIINKEREVDDLGVPLTITINVLDLNDSIKSTTTFDNLWSLNYIEAKKLLNVVSEKLSVRLSMLNGSLEERHSGINRVDVYFFPLWFQRLM